MGSVKSVVPMTEQETRVYSDLDRARKARRGKTPIRYSIARMNGEKVLSGIDSKFMRGFLPPITFGRARELLLMLKDEYPNNPERWFAEVSDEDGCQFKVTWKENEHCIFLLTSPS